MQCTRKNTWHPWKWSDRQSRIAFCTSRVLHVGQWEVRAGTESTEVVFHLRVCALAGFRLRHREPIRLAGEAVGSKGSTAGLSIRPHFGPAQCSHRRGWWDDRVPSLACESNWKTESMGPDRKSCVPFSELGSRLYSMSLPAPLTDLDAADTARSRGTQIKMPGAGRWLTAHQCSRRPEGAIGVRARYEHTWAPNSRRDTNTICDNVACAWNQIVLYIASALTSRMLHIPCASWLARVGVCVSWSCMRFGA